MTLLQSTAAGFVVLALMFGPLERAFPRRLQPVVRPGLRLDLAYFFSQYLIWAGVSLWVLERIQAAAHASPSPLPFWLQAVLVFTLGDVAVYWFHRACHSVGFLWRFHAVHHSVEHLDWVAAHREHPLDGLITQIVVNLPAIALGFPLAVLGPVIVFRGLWAVFIHSNVRLPLGPLRVLLGAPELHHWHHARVAVTRHNFGNLAPWTDVVFGTYFVPAGEFELGLVEPIAPTWLGQLVAPFGGRGHHPRARGMAGWTTNWGSWRGSSGACSRGHRRSSSAQSRGRSSAASQAASGSR